MGREIKRNSDAEGRSAVSSALSRGLNLLVAFIDAPVWLSNSDLVEKTSFPAPTVARLTRSLADMGLLHYSTKRRRYRLAAGVMQLGGSAEGGVGLIESVRPLIQQFADQHLVHVSLAALDGAGARIVEVFHSSSTLVTLRLESGYVLPLAGTATGHALLSCLPIERREPLIGELALRHPHAWPALRKAMMAAFEEVKRNGYTRSMGSWYTDINAVAAPLHCPHHDAIMSIACSGPAQHLPPERLEEVGHALVPLAEALCSRAAEELHTYAGH
ncbi:IclR family transcriptional regulator [Nitratireductor indicus]|uniref:IclR family transcriptional regulator n=1 Tax=Nitratireductor indicus TaxID=721133 RepID=UPI002874F717|nr:IclR family transcriptional regulator [Nitratireductor indicus]MDS1136458.1 IclR family transcriptional regulator [Nitratireductor indicus]